MSEQGFTPGPWEAELLTKHSAPNERPWVGRLEEGRYSALSCGETQAEAIANARLIAAARELYEALTRARHALVAFTNCHDAIAQCDAALQKGSSHA